MLIVTTLDMYRQGDFLMYHIIVNPASKSGKGLTIWKILEPVFMQKGVPYRAYISSHSGHVTELVLEITKTTTILSDCGIINLILLGGDGTVNEALQGIRDFNRVNIGYIPTGSSNDFARALKLERNPIDLLNRILNNSCVRKIDLGILTYENALPTMSIPHDLHKPSEHARRYFIVSSGIGFDAAVCKEALSSPMKDTLNKLKLGKLTYLGIALRQLFAAKHASCTIYPEDGKPIHIPKFLFGAFMIHPYEGGGFYFCPQADNGDGLLDLCIVGNLPKFLILFALPTAFWGKHYIFPKINHYRAAGVRIETSIPLWVHTDGEVHAKANRIYISCSRQCVRFLA